MKKLTEEEFDKCFGFGKKSNEKGINHPLDDLDFANFVFSHERYRDLIGEFLDSWDEGWYTAFNPPPHWKKYKDNFAKSLTAKDEEEYRKAWGYDKDEEEYLDDLIYNRYPEDRRETHITGSSSGDWFIAIFGFLGIGYMSYIFVSVILSIFFGVRI